MASGRCPRPNCGEATQAVFGEEGSHSTEVRLFLLTGVRSCPRDGIIETAVRDGRSEPIHLGRLIRGEVERTFPLPGNRVWRSCEAGEPSEMITPDPNSAVRHWLRIASVRWDPAKGQVVALMDSSIELAVQAAADRTTWTVVPPSIEPELRRQDLLLRGRTES